ncbi:TonB-dependent receptor domain-containing protein [Comamonas sp. C24C]
MNRWATGADSALPQTYSRQVNEHAKGSRTAIAMAIGMALLGQAWAAENPARPAAAAQADAAQERVEFDLPRGDLGQALVALGAAAGLRLVFDPQKLQGLSAPAVRGAMTPGEALTRLLHGSGFAHVFTGNGVVRLKPVSGPSAEAASAAETQEDEPPSRIMSTVLVLADAERDEKDRQYRTAGSSNVLKREDIERFRGTSVGDIFQGTPGVLIGENRNSGGLDVNIRGMQGQGRVPVLVDGARQETTVYRGYAGVASRSYIDPDLIGGIQIEKGPVMGAQGTGAVGGLVSARTLNADDIVRPGQTFGIRLRGSLIGNNSGSAPAPGTKAGFNTGGSSSNGTGGVYRTNCVIASLCEGPFDIANVVPPSESMNRPGLMQPKSWAGSIALAKRFEKADIVAAYARRSQGNYYAGTKGPVPALDLSETYNRGFYTEVVPKVVGATRFRGGERIVNTNHENESVLLKTRLYLPNDQELEAGYMRYTSTYGELMPSQLLWLGQVAQTSNSKVTADTYTLRHRWNPENNDWLNLTSNLWHTNTDSLNQNYSEETVNEMFGAGSENYKRWGFDVSNSMRFASAGGIKLDYGLAAQLEKVNGVATGNMLSSGGRLGRRTEWSLFTDLQWKPLPSVTLGAGLRHTRFESRDDKPMLVSPDSAYCVDSKGTGSCDPLMMNSRNNGTSPMFSALWDVTPSVQLYARHARAMRMPSLFETTAGYSVSPSQDIHLRPERTLNREIGINFLKDGVWRSSDKLRAKLAYFSNTTKDYLTRTFPNTWEEGSGRQFFTLRNIESVSFDGFEVSGSYDMGPVFMEASGTRYTFIETCHFGSFRRYTCTDYGIANSYVNNMIPPKWHASALLGARLLERKLTVGVRGTFMGKRNPTPEFNNETAQGFNQVVPWHSYVLWDVFASYKLSDRVNVDFNVDNVTDRYYLDALSLGMVPAPGRTARLSVTLQF